jgi:hypothetical protein
VLRVVSWELLWLRHGDSSGTKRKGNVCSWKLLQVDIAEDCSLRRLGACLSELLLLFVVMRVK